ncbi:acyl-CoA--6-aminopenicillanic acid acyl-transferase [Arenibacter sp. BSSL-BM3]|uniref:Acyl-CoA--6-aminopenicillanic acid acyl-transferase n=1 Tax=Arenibacter arenosicollis TaxID=2762274 RepID=A0ABR7QSI3_9FLAO|nr:C45 family peptidase [Arenibacter arenosicollis]MBC8770150.1 acyl-CoA--6-aminopenicillanic acid acyl-transferase [Arenibacter arenosicollis]
MHRIKWIICLSALLGLLGSCGISKSLKDRPNISAYNPKVPEITKTSDTSFVYSNNHLTKNKQGLWELYVSGDPLQRGLITGALTEELFQHQEAIFLSKVKQLVPSKTKRYFLKKFLAWYNRKMYKNIPEEIKVEIWGLSKYASDDFDYIAEPYSRVLYLHGAHDIGHALQDLALVGCSSFAAWGDKSDDGSLIIGRNFDFYAGDDFAKNKIISFVDPTEGHKFMSVTWGGMMGVVSGMNEHGLTVTINAGKSKIPLVAKTPISIVAREILQYAATLEEAVAIAKKRQVFVSESILVGSASDKKAIVIEVSPHNFGVYEVPNTNQLICSNHFQSDAYAKDKNNKKQILESHSNYRYERLEELLGNHEKITPKIAVDILRNKEGLRDMDIGYGNEKALNQLLAHHGIVFKPEQGLVWVSSNPYQLGEFVAYNLNKIFKDSLNHGNKTTLSIANKNIKKDSFLYTLAYQNYEEYRSMSDKIKEAVTDEKHLTPEFLEKFKTLNPEYWETYYWVGRYYYHRKYYLAALNAFKEASTKEITTVPKEALVHSYIRRLKRKLK